MKRISAASIAVFTFMLLALSSLQSCSDNKLGYEGNWVIVDTVGKNDIMKTTVKLSDNNFEILYSEKYDTSKYFINQIVQKGKNDIFAEKMNFYLKEYGYLAKDTSKTLTKITQKDTTFRSHIDTLKKVANRYVIDILVTDTLSKYRFEVFNDRLNLITDDEKYIFKRE